MLVLAKQDDDGGLGAFLACNHADPNGGDLLVRWQARSSSCRGPPWWDLHGEREIMRGEGRGRRKEDEA